MMTKPQTKFKACEIFLLARPLADIWYIDPTENHLQNAHASAAVALDYLDDAAGLLSEGGEIELAAQYRAMAERMADDGYQHLKLYLGHWA